MKKLLLPVAMLVFFALPSMANAETCRNAKGQFAKCGTAGAKVVAGTAVAVKPAKAPAKASGPCKDAKGKFIKCGTAAAPAMAPAKPAPAMAAKPAAVKKAPCKNDKGKFIKCPA